MLTIPPRQHLKINRHTREGHLAPGEERKSYTTGENPTPVGHCQPSENTSSGGRSPPSPSRRCREHRAAPPAPLAPRQTPTDAVGSVPAPGKEAGFGHLMPSQPCFSSRPIFPHSRGSPGDVCLSRGQNGAAWRGTSPHGARPSDGLPTAGCFASKPRVISAWL